MLTGYNTDFKFQDKVYHCQTEDGGVHSPFVTSLMYHQGAILARRKTSYEDIIKADCLEDVVRELMMEQHKQMIRDLMQGKLELNVNATPQEASAPAKTVAPAAAPTAPAPKAPPPPSKPKEEEIKEKSLDDVILEFLVQEDKAKNK
jgi:ribosomal protein L12E/L44/L45/RPP1/RPP2